MQTQTIPSLFSELTIEEAQTLWVTLVNASRRGLRRGLGEEFAEEIGEPADAIEAEFGDLMADDILDFEMCDAPNGDVYLAPWLPDYSDVDMAEAVFSATAGLR
jgi:hypothetical protein